MLSFYMDPLTTLKYTELGTVEPFAKCSQIFREKELVLKPVSWPSTEFYSTKSDPNMRWLLLLHHCFSFLHTEKSQLHYLPKDRQWSDPSNRKLSKGFLLGETLIARYAVLLRFLYKNQNPTSSPPFHYRLKSKWLGEKMIYYYSPEPMNHRLITDRYNIWGKAKMH